MAKTIGVEVVDWIFSHYGGLATSGLGHYYQPAIINADHDTRQQLEKEIDAIVTRRTIVLADVPGAKHS